MLGNQFLVPGRFYQVITYRPDTSHYDHWFPTGTIVKCIDVVRANEHKSILGYPEFSHPTLTGLFIDENGVDQVMCTGDVRVCRLS